MVFNILRKLFARMKSHYIESLGFIVPPDHNSAFVHWGGGAETIYIFGKFIEGLPTDGRALIVGGANSRDYFFLKNLGMDITLVDLGPQSYAGDIIIANIEEPLPFNEGQFDLIILSEVLEHLIHDASALNNIHHVLKASGRLIVSLPYHNDWEPGHVRVHTPKSAKMLLNSSGFEVIDSLDRPALFWPWGLNFIPHIISLFPYLLVGRTAYAWLNRVFGSFSWQVGKISWLRIVRNKSRFWGGYFLCEKGKVFNYVEENRKAYTKSFDDKG